MSTIHCQEFHELAMDYRGAPIMGASPAYLALCNYIDARLQMVAYCKADLLATETLRNQMYAEAEFASWVVTAKREWRKPTEADRTRKCRARSRYEKNPFYVEWNSEFEAWAIADKPHILIRVDEVLSP